MIGTAARITPANHLLDATTRRTLGQVLSIVEAGAMLSACPDTRIVVLHRKRLVTPNENKISHRWRGPAFSSPFYFRISLLQFSKRPAVGCIEWLGALCANTILLEVSLDCCHVAGRLERCHRNPME